MEKAFTDYYRCPPELVAFAPPERPWAGPPGFFQFGPGVTCYGSASIPASGTAAAPLPDAREHVRIEGTKCVLPFDPTEVMDNLRFERYVVQGPRPLWKRMVRGAYYAARPALPVGLRRHLQRRWLRGWEGRAFPRWPVDPSVDRLCQELMHFTLAASGRAAIPFIWFWPEGKSSCAIMTHDVETAAGLAFASELMDINDSFGIKSSFQLIPQARYSVTTEAIGTIRDRGFEVNVHDLLHDGRLYEDHQCFLRSAVLINESAERFGSRGFRSGVLYRELEWYSAFTFSYDMSVPNMGHLDPQPGGCCTVMPYFVGNILELPVTTTQDYSLFHILGTHTTDLWREQIRQIKAQYGLISFIVHPDYLNTAAARNAYAEVLTELARLRAAEGMWCALPGEVDIWWRQRSAMKLVSSGTGWRIEGAGSERARIAFATTEGDRIRYLFN